MTTDAMMAEIRKVHPNADTYRRMSKPYEWVVATHDGTGAVLATNKTEWLVVESAYRAVRKAKPKPLTVAEAKAAVLRRVPRATCSKPANGRFSGRWVVWENDGTDDRLAVSLTEGAAWKAAAQALTRETTPCP